MITMAPEESADVRGSGADHSAGYPLGEWPANWGERHRRRSTGMLWLGIVLMLIAAAMAGFSGGVAGPLWSGVVLALFGLTALVVAAHRPFGRGRMRLVDTATLTRGRVPTPDVRVLFVAERPSGVILLLLSAVWAVVLAAATVVAVQIGAAGRPQAFLGAAVVGLFAVLFGYVAVRGAVSRYRFDAFGRRPVGLGIGPDGVTLIRVEDTVHVPWTAIRGVEAAVTEPRRGLDRLPLIKLGVNSKRAFTTGRRRVPSTITVAPATFQVHPQVLWSALREFHRSPASSDILGTTAGEQLLDGWRTAAG